MSMLMMLQEMAKPDLTWNYILLAVMIAITLILGYAVIRKRRREE